MTTTMTILHIDTETCNTVELRQVGADVYSRSSTLIVTVLAWAFDDGPVHSVTLPQVLPPPVHHHLAAGGAFKAWNAAFEEAILRNHYGLPLAAEQAVCTMQAALHSGLPAKLEDAGPAIGAQVHKDPSMRALMRDMGKPKDPSIPTYWHQDPAKLFDLRVYCERDVESERAIGKMISPLPPRETLLSAIDRRANRDGIKLDLPLVRKLRELARVETQLLNIEASVITGGHVTSPGTQGQKTIDWLMGQGLMLKDASKESIGEAIAHAKANRFPADVQRLLRIRQEAAKSSVRKLDAMLRCAGPGDRVRGQLAYYGAARTGRWAGRLVQPQNFPRPVPGVKQFIEDVLDGPSVTLDRQALPIMDMVASSLRGCLIPAKGKAFIAYDLAQIEARILAWLAGQDDVLEVFESGFDIYAWTAQTLGLPDRQAGKVARLALGYQMGPSKLIDAAKNYGLTLSLAQAEVFVQAFRAKSPRIVALWARVDFTAKRLLQCKADHHIIVINPMLTLESNTAKNGQSLMTMLLPSGRRLYYRNARLGTDDRGRAVINYDGVDPITKRWGTLKSYGGKLVENATQAVARDVLAEGLIGASAIEGEHRLVLSVHDEAIFEVPIDDAPEYDRRIRLAMTTMPSWADGLPVKADGGVMMRYGK